MQHLAISLIALFGLKIFILNYIIFNQRREKLILFRFD